MNTQRVLDIEKVLECRSSIVKDINRMLVSDLKSVFSGSALIEWLFNNYNLSNTNRQGLTELVHEELFNPALSNQLVYPVEEGEAFQDSDKHFYRFIDSQFKEFKKDDHILNLYGVDTSSLQHFYEKNENESIQTIIDELKVVVEEIYSNFLDESKTLIDYIRLEESEVFNSRFLPIITKFAYADLSQLLTSQNELKAFFINIYNVLSIHAVISHYRKEKRLNIFLVERPSFYASYKYNIGGHNYTLSDIEQGIFRKNSNMAVDLTSTVLDFAFGTKSKGERFTLNDSRRKFVLQYLDPRVHFALSPGIISCPSYRYYTAVDIDTQLEIAAREYCEINSYLREEKGKKYFEVIEMFKFYKTDFAPSDNALINYIVSYLKDETREKISQEVEKNEVQLKFISYNWDLNKRFNS